MKWIVYRCNFKKDIIIQKSYKEQGKGYRDIEDLEKYAEF